MSALPTEEFTIRTTPTACLPDSFWTGRPVLEHVRQAARARLVAPDALLGAVLVRVAAITPHSVEIPAIVGSPVGFTFFAALVGGPSTGKSAAADVAAELVPAPASVLDRLPVGSGEGFVELMFEIVEEDDNGKKVKVKRQTKHAAIFHVDEGAVLADLGNRAGSTLLPVLRSAWTSGTLGNTNASAERRRILPAGSYVYGLTLGIQPELAGPILADANAGTPQRFIWLIATDPAAPDETPEWPGCLSWEPPDHEELGRRQTSRDGWVRQPLTFHRTIWEVVQSHRLAVMRGETIVDTIDAHRNLLRLKTAGLLALLDRRIDPNEDDWRLAGIITATSSAVRAGVETALLKVEAGKETAAADRTARREIRVEDTKAEKALTSATRSVAGIVARHAERDEHKAQGGGCTRRCLTNAVAGKHRELVAIDDVIAKAEENGWIAIADERWISGESRPA